jgi:hypothetical protein
MLSALQVNLARGRLPAPEAEGRRYLRIPLKRIPSRIVGWLERVPKHEETARYGWSARDHCLPKNDSTSQRSSTLLRSCCESPKILGSKPTNHLFRSIGEW